MHWPGRTIWDTRIQGVCGVVSARGLEETAIFVSATFAQISLSPPRIIVNPNRTFSIEPAMKETGRFAISVMPLSKRNQIVRLMRVRRRQPNRAAIVGLVVREDNHEIPFIDGALRTIFCEVERSIDSGDRKLYVAKVLESRGNPSVSGERPLLFADVSGGPLRFVFLQKSLRKVLAISGALDLLKRTYYRLKPPLPPDIAANTYEEGGATENEIETINKHGVLDLSRRLQPPPAPAIVRKQLGVC